MADAGLQRLSSTSQCWDMCLHSSRVAGIGECDLDRMDTTCLELVHWHDSLAIVEQMEAAFGKANDPRRQCCCSVASAAHACPVSLKCMHDADPELLVPMSAADQHQTQYFYLLITGGSSRLSVVIDSLHRR